MVTNYLNTFQKKIINTLENIKMRIKYCQGLWDLDVVLVVNGSVDMQGIRLEQTMLCKVKNLY